MASALVQEALARWERNEERRSRSSHILSDYSCYSSAQRLVCIVMMSAASWWGLTACPTFSTIRGSVSLILRHPPCSHARISA